MTTELAPGIGKSPIFRHSSVARFHATRKYYNSTQCEIVCKCTNSRRLLFFTSLPWVSAWFDREVRGQGPSLTNIFFSFFFWNNERPRAARSLSSRVEWKRAETLAKLADCQCDVERTRNPRCLMKWKVSAQKLPACNIRKKSEHFGLTSESAGEKLLWTVKNQARRTNIQIKR